MSKRDVCIDPGTIEERSFAIIDAEVPEPRGFEGDEWRIVRRMIHTTADFELLSRVRFHPDAVSQGIASLIRGCLIVTDTEMARVGISSRRTDPLGCTVTCLMNDPEVKAKAEREKTTRAAAAVDYAIPRLDRGICVVGNAPTALLRLMEWMQKGKCRPALVVGVPVGFVNASESKEMLMGQDKVPYITIEGRKGGSALAACVVNQLAEMALEAQGM